MGHPRAERAQVAVVTNAMGLSFLQHHLPASAVVVLFGGLWESLDTWRQARARVRARVHAKGLPFVPEGPVFPSGMGL